MPTISFDIFKLTGCVGVCLVETTGRQPTDPEGYGEFEDISGYTATLVVRNKVSQQVLYTLTATPDAGKTSQNIYISTDQTEKMIDGYHEIVYTVMNGSTVVGTATKYLTTDCGMICQIEELINKQISGCDNCKDKAMKVVQEVRGFVRSGSDFRSVGNNTAGESLFSLAVRKSAQNCKC